MFDVLNSSEIKPLLLELLKLGAAAGVGSAATWVVRSRAKLWLSAVRLAEWVVLLHAIAAACVGIFLFFGAQLDLYDQQMALTSPAPLGYFFIALLLGRAWRRQFWRGVRFVWGAMILVSWALFFSPVPTGQSGHEVTNLLLFLELQWFVLLAIVVFTLATLFVWGCIRGAESVANKAKEILDETIAPWT
jgi:hypothetical protein